MKRLFGNELSTLFLMRNASTARASSFALDGTNRDFVTLRPGETHTLCTLKGPGIIRHIWITIGSSEAQILRKAVLRMYWDGEASPSVEAPVGDFFGVGFGVSVNFVSEPLSMCPQDGKGMNCYFPMPFSREARLTLTLESEGLIELYYYVDYERVRRLPRASGRFHAQWRREQDTDGAARRDPGLMTRPSPRPFDQPYTWPEGWDLQNRDGAHNYVILEAQGQGHYVGCNLNIDNFEKQVNDWYGEGDDMIFIDGERWPPRLHGTGTEDYFNTAYCPTQTYCAPWHGLTLYSGDTTGRPFGGRNSMYRFHIPDPIRFRRSIRVTIEHGHANKLSNDYSSTAYWYQSEPHAPFPPLPGAKARLARPCEPSQRPQP